MQYADRNSVKGRIAVDRRRSQESARVAMRLVISIYRSTIFSGDYLVDALLLALTHLHEFNVVDETHDAEMFHEELATFDIEVR